MGSHRTQVIGVDHGMNVTESQQGCAGEVRARAHGARLLQVPGRVLQGLNPVPGGGGKSEKVGERGAEEKTHLRGEKKLRGHFLSFPPSRTGRRSSDEYLKWNGFSKDGLSSATLVSEIYFYQLI